MSYKLAYVSQRVDTHLDYKERRDALDQRLVELLWKAGCIALPISNHQEVGAELLKICPPDVIFLSGGNSPNIYGGTAPERDKLDILLLDYAVKNKIPLLGCCRGMQSVVLYFGGTLHKVNGHVATRHIVNGDISREVNSYHQLTPKQLPDTLISAGCSIDGEIEYIKHKNLPIEGIMWHPERESIFDERDMALIRRLFGI